MIAASSTNSMVHNLCSKLKHKRSCWAANPTEAILVAQSHVRKFLFSLLSHQQHLFDIGEEIPDLNIRVSCNFRVYQKDGVA
jgi:hypothetical protein